MKIKLAEADEVRVRQLESVSAFTWEGMDLDEGNIEQIANIFLSEELVKEGTEEITGYWWLGGLMNSMYGLHGENAYPDDLPFLSFDNDSFDGAGNLNVFKLSIGARWLDDIVRNNALNEEEMNK
jgi:hypothetical protein